MNEIFKKIYADKIAGWSFSTSSLLFLVTLFAILIRYRDLPPYLPLYNKLSWGYARLGNTYEFFLLPSLILFLLILNTFFGLFFQQKMPLLSRFLFVTTLSAALFATFFTLKLLLVIL